MPFVNIDYGYQAQVFGPASVATSTTYIIPQSDGLSSLRIVGTGFTYDGNGVPTGGVITAVEIIINDGGGVLNSLTDLHVSLADYGATLSTVLALRAQLDWIETSPPDSLVSWTPTYIRISNADGTFTDVHGAGFDLTDLNNLVGTVSSVDLVDTNGSTILDTVTGLNADLADLVAAFGEENAADRLLMLLHTGDNTIVTTPITVGDTTYIFVAVDGPGSDTYYAWGVDFSFSSTGVTANVATGVITHDGDTDTLNGPLPNVTGIWGSMLDDVMSGHTSADRLSGIEGDDELAGLTGDDTLNGGAGADTLDGGADNDTADYYDYGQDYLLTGVTVSLAIVGAQDTLGAGVDTLINVENLSGSHLADTFTGNGNANILSGLEGDDTLHGGGDADVLLGGAGVDAASYDMLSNTADWHRNPNGTWTVTAGADGVDTLVEVEFLQFSDRNVFLARPENSFFGDGTSDVLLRRTDGVTAIWNMSGALVTSAAPTQWQAPADWSIQGVGDFNSDGRDDFLLRRTDGVTAIWSMNGTNVVAADVTLWQAGNDWQILDVGDFNGDGRDDILWRRTADGVTSIWQMDGTDVIAADVTLWQAGTEWEIQGVGDFNGDGRDDFLWRRVSDGVTAIWEMDGANVTAADVTSQQAGAEWSFVGLGDFDGDGRDDMLLRRTDGVSAIWRMDGSTTLSAALTSQQAAADWSVAAVGDYNGDGRDDILLRHDDGLIAVWTMDGFTVVSAELTSQTAGAEWGVI